MSQSTNSDNSIRSVESALAVDDVIQHIVNHPLNRDLSHSNLLSLAYTGIKLLEQKQLPDLLNDDKKNIILATIQQCVNGSGLPSDEKEALDVLIRTVLPTALDLFVDGLNTVIAKAKKTCGVCCFRRNKSAATPSTTPSVSVSN